MRTIVEPKQHVDRLWGKQRVHEEKRYRLMRYVLRVDHDNSVLLHNGVTGRLVVLDPAEADVLGSLPSAYKPAMKPLIEAHYLVPEDCDEHQQVLNLKHILRRLMPPVSCEGAAITDYTILPTSACNARCYYCYEHGIRKTVMTEQTAADTVRFITEHCGPRKRVSIRWFGGEPTTAVPRIDQICEGLRLNGIGFVSNMTTNGYLFDEDLVCKAKDLWNLRDVMISVDGTEIHYNEIKDYINPQDNPYQRVMRNVGLLLDAGIRVNLRMNFDIGNYLDFYDLLKEAKERYHGSKLLKVYAFPVKGEYPDKSGEIHHPGPAWSVDRLVELNDAACETGMFERSGQLPALFFTNCSAGNPSSMVISPDGELGRCLDLFVKDGQAIGTVSDGIVLQNYCEKFLHLADPEACRDCVLFPDCVLVKGCPSGNECFICEHIRKTEAIVRKAYDYWKSHSEEVSFDDIAGAESRLCAD